MPLRSLKDESLPKSCDKPSNFEMNLNLASLDVRAIGNASFKIAEAPSFGEESSRIQEGTIFRYLQN
jgi:hypothetical protein